MQLTVPQRTQAEAGSFPTNPEGVTQWLQVLQPLESDTDAREIYRGLKHSNRLHNNVDQRRAVLSCFIPVLRELQSYLSEMTQAQPLPLSREFSRSARLSDALYREEAFAFKILLSESNTPLADDAGRAMQALARQAECQVHTYQRIPDSLIHDAHQLYILAEKHTLLTGSRGSDLLSLEDHYRFILLLSIADLGQQRARQLPLLLNFLKTCIRDIQIEKDRDRKSLAIYDYAINVNFGAKPEPALSLLGEQISDVRWFSIAPVLYRIDTHSARLRASSTTSLGSDTLERQSLARLHVALSRARQRRSPRKIQFESQRVIFGHKEVCTHLLYQLEEKTSHDTTNWRVVNSSAQGLCIQNSQCRTGLVQVGELVSITNPGVPLRAPDAPKSSKLDASLGVVRWVRASGTGSGNGGIVIGVEILARSVLPVRVLRDERNPAAQANTILSTQHSDRDIGVGENALIVACKVKNTILQTMLTPCYLYQSGDRLTASQGGRSRKMRLRNCLQTNGLFSQFSLVDVVTGE
ncbi:MAG: hypothetical protein ACI8VW_002968 [bacterium]|jgi:hypothetical protein